MKSHFLKFLILISSFASSSAYDIRCIYPRALGDDLFDVDLNANKIVGDSRAATGQYETPHVVWTAVHNTHCRALCLSYHEPNVLDIYSGNPTFSSFQVPEFGHNAYSMIMCTLQCAVHIWDGTFDMAERFVDHYNEMGVDITLPSARLDIKDALEELQGTYNPTAINTITGDDDYHPYTMGHIAGFQIKDFMYNDGWNFMGDLKWNSELNAPAPCTGSCRRFSNTIGYSPMPDPRKLPPLDEGKYECTGICRRWQPLQEGDDAGNLKHQEFIFPHIGYDAHTYLREASVMLDDPQYDLYEESLLVVERLKNTTMDQYMKDAVDFMDDKLLVRGYIQFALKDMFEEELSFQDLMIFFTGIGLAEYDAVVQAWLEKTHHDLVRPTTVIKHWGNDTLYTYGGDRSLNHPVEITAEDFEAFIRVMPHAEFPSGSSCLCTTYAEFTEVFTSNMYNSTLTDIAWTVNGRDYVEDNLWTYRDVCGESRLWGGMHYTAAIDAGTQVCSGLGELGYDFADNMRNGAVWNDPWYPGDTLDACPN